MNGCLRRLNYGCCLDKSQTQTFTQQRLGWTVFSNDQRT